MRCILFAGFAALAVTCAHAEEFRGSISGAVTDATGASIAGAKIAITEINTGAKVDTSSDSSGHYSAPFLLPGDYDIAVRMDGLKEFVRKGLRVGAGETPVVDARLEVGTAQQSVEVEASAPLVNSENAPSGRRSRPRWSKTCRATGALR